MRCRGPPREEDGSPCAAAARLAARKSRGRRWRENGREGWGKKEIKKTDVWTPQLVVGIESDIEDGWVRRN